MIMLREKSQRLWKKCQYSKIQMRHFWVIFKQCVLDVNLSNLRYVMQNESERVWPE